MTERPTPTSDHPDAGWYVIRVAAVLDARWAGWFDGMTLSVERDGTTVIAGPVADQAALHGVLQRLRDLGIPLVSVTRTDPDESPMTGPDQG